MPRLPGHFRFQRSGPGSAAAFNGSGLLQRICVTPCEMQEGGAISTYAKRPGFSSGPCSVTSDTLTSTGSDTTQPA